jgi:hypothetical protein
VTQKLLANPNKAIEKSTKFINRIKSNQDNLLVLLELNQYLKTQQLEKIMSSVERRSVNKEINYIVFKQITDPKGSKTS